LQIDRAPREWGFAAAGGWLKTVLGLVICLHLIPGCGSEPPSGAPPAETKSAVRDTAKRIGDLSLLVGRWQRPDGGYVLEIARVADDGTVEAAYFNPKPIKISTARAEWWRGGANLFVEFDDLNYRGSTYQLVHEPERDVLHGTYYQATMGQTFEVVFVRLR
jgi:hypothetical protein